MKAILEFNLPEEQEYFESAQKANSLFMVIQALDNHLRSEIKYNDLLSQEEHKYANSVRDKLWELVKDYNLGDLL